MPYRSPTSARSRRRTRGRFRGFDVLDSVEAWDDVTAGVVLARLALPGELAFFTPTEVAVAAPLLDLLLAQDGEPRVPVLALIDHRLAVGETDGWHYDDLPEDAQAWRDTLAALDADARDAHSGRGFAALVALGAGGAGAGGAGPRRRRRPMARLARLAGLEPVDPLRLHRLLLPPLGLERDRLPRPGLPARLPQPRRRRAGTLGGRATSVDRDPVPFAARVETRPRRATPTCSAARAGRLMASAARSNYADIRARNESAWLLPNDGSRTNHRLRADMRRYADGDEVDLVVVGAGAGGGVLTQRLARAGWRVVCLDAGPFWDPDTDWVSDERGSHTLYWTEPRQIGGADPVPLGSNNSGRGVGGSMVHYAGYTPRLHPSDFRTYTADGVGADWPIDYADLQPYYAAIEQELPVAGQDWPWGDPHTYPHHPHPVGGNGEIFLRGAGKRRHRGPGRPGRDPQRPLRQPAALHLPRLLPAGLQGQRQGQPADHPHPRRARARRRDPPRLARSPGSSSTTAPAP